MTKDEIIEMARQAGCGHEAIDLHWVYPENLEAFAKLVAQHERESCIDIVAMFGGSIEIEAAIRTRGLA
jgi:hypothetical protein